jgi:hypothetical protein
VADVGLLEANVAQQPSLCTGWHMLGHWIACYDQRCPDQCDVWLCDLARCRLLAIMYGLKSSSFQLNTEIALVLLLRLLALAPGVGETQSFNRVKPCAIKTLGVDLCLCTAVLLRQLFARAQTT